MRNSVKKGISLVITFAMMLALMPASFASVDWGSTYDEIEIELINRAGETVPVSGAKVSIRGGVVEGSEFLLDGDVCTDENGQVDYDRHYRMSVRYTITLPDDYDDCEFDLENIILKDVLAGSTQIHNVGADETSLLVGVTPISNQELPIIDEFDFDRNQEGRWELKFRVGNPEKSGNPAILRAVDDAPLAGGTSFIKIKLAEKPYENHKIVVNSGVAKVNGVTVAEAKKGTTVDISASVIDSKNFLKWKVDKGDVTIENIEQSESSFEMPDEDVEITAYYRNAYNIYMAGDDYYTLYIEGEKFHSPDSQTESSNYTAVRKIYKEGVSENTFFAAKGEDTAGNIAAFKMMYEYYDDVESKYKGTDEDWYYYVGDGESEPVDTDGNKWYEKEYKAEGWEKVTTIDQREGWVIDDAWPENSNNASWIWSNNWAEDSNKDGVEGFDKVVYLRSIAPQALDENEEDNDNGNDNGSSENEDSNNEDNNEEGDDGNSGNGDNDNTDNDGNDNSNSYVYTSDDDVVDIEEENVALGKLNKEDQIAYIYGYPDGTVRPNGYLAREEAAAVFSRLLDKDYKKMLYTNENNFVDVDPNRWSNEDISILAKAGILNGYADGTFRPFEPIKRGELAIIAANFEGLDKNASHNFTDIKGSFAEPFIASAAKRGWVEAEEGGKFRPNDNITRAEFVTFVNNVLGWHVKKENILPGIKTFTDLSNEDAPYYTAMVIATNTYKYEKLDDNYQKWTKLLTPEMGK